MKFALIPGQGKISPRLIAADFPEKEWWLKEAASLLGVVLNEVTIQSHVVEQVCIVAHAFACHDYYLKNGGHLDGVAGYSVGQYGALGIAGVLDKRSCLELVKERAEMLAKFSSSEMGMLSVLGADEKNTQECISALQNKQPFTEKSFVEISNFNTSFSQTVAGEIALLKQIREMVLSRGAARSELLEVKGAWHSRMLLGMRHEFQELLSTIPFSNPRILYVDNVTGTIQNNASTIRELLVDHLHQPVQWKKTTQTLQSLKPKTVMEWGPEDQLQKMLFFASPPLRTVAWKTAGEMKRCVESQGS